MTKTSKNLRGLRPADLPRPGRSEIAYENACNALWYFRLFYMRTLQESPHNVFVRAHLEHTVGLLRVLHSMAPDFALCAEQAAYMAQRIQRLPTYGNKKCEALVQAHAKAYT